MKLRIEKTHLKRVILIWHNSQPHFTPQKPYATSPGLYLTPNYQGHASEYYSDSCRRDGVWGKLLIIYICNFHVISNLLLIHICKLHWNTWDPVWSEPKQKVRQVLHLHPRRQDPGLWGHWVRWNLRGWWQGAPRTCHNLTQTCHNLTRTLPRTWHNLPRTLSKLYGICVIHSRLITHKSASEESSDAQEDNEILFEADVCYAFIT